MPRHEEMVEPDITINGTPLTFAQAMTVRVAVTQFQMYCRGKDQQKVLGQVGENYQARLREIFQLIMKNQPPKGAV